MQQETVQRDKILIIDDNPHNLGVLFSFLSEVGFKVFVAIDGLSALEKVIYTQPDIILLDILMPGYDGYETCKQLKLNPSTRDIPIIFMTALTDTKDKVKGFQLGAVDYITKPLQNEEVLSRIQTHLAIRNLQKQLQVQNQHLQKEIQERQLAEEALRNQEYWLNTLLNAFPDYIWMKDGEGKWLIANQPGIDLFQLSGVDYRGKKDSELAESSQFYREVLLNRAATDLEAWQQGTLSCSEEIIPRPNGYSTILNVRKIPLFNTDGTRKSLVVVGQDVTERKQIELTLQQTHERERLVGLISQRIRMSLNLSDILTTAVHEVRAFLQTHRVIICQFQSDGSWESIVESLGSDCESTLEWKMSHPWVLDINSSEEGRWQEVLAIHDIYAMGWEPSYLQLLEIFNVRAMLVVPILQNSTVQSNTDLTQESDRTLMACPLSFKMGVVDGKSLYQPALPSHLYYPLWGWLIAHQCGEPRQWQKLEMDLLQHLATQLAIAIQQSQLYQRLEIVNQELARLASLDGLTQVANRRSFDKHLELQWQQMARERMPLSLIMCDVDFFKLYNDTYGHKAGDDCLKKIAAVMQKVAKRPMDLVARYGGEEFAAILPNTTLKGARRVAEAIRHAVKSLNIEHEKSDHHWVTVSLGVATLIPTPDFSPALLIATADKALYEAKAQGRNCIEIGFWQDEERNRAEDF